MIDKQTASSMLHATSGGQFHVMAKPAGSTCNLDCKYCFYLSKETLRNGPGTGQMSEDTLELFIRQYIEGVTGPQLVFSWQGGEPTLRGLDFLPARRRVAEEIRQSQQRIENDLQTNGVLLDEDWAAFLKEHRFLVGLSIDGPRELHDQFRVNKGGAPTFDKVMAAAKLLRKFGVPFNTLTCVHRLNASRPLDVYRFLRSELNATYIQFIPIVQAEGIRNDGAAAMGRVPAADRSAVRKRGPTIPIPWSPTGPSIPRNMDIFYRRVFDEWRRKDLGKVLVNHFETLVAQHLGLPSQICIYNEFCGKGVAVEHDGSVYSCDHYVYPEYRLGTLREKPLAEMVFSPDASQIRLCQIGNTCRATAASAPI